MQDIKILSDVEAIKALSDSFRLKILKTLQKEGSASATQIADELDESASKISYHIKILEKHGIITLEDTRIKGNIVEKIYTPAAKEFKLEIKKKSEQEEFYGSEFLPIVKDLSSTIEKDLLELANSVESLEDDSSSVLSYGTYYLTDEELEELSEDIMSKLRKYMMRDKEDIKKRVIDYGKYNIGFLLIDKNLNDKTK